MLMSTLVILRLQVFCLHIREFTVLFAGNHVPHEY